MIVEHLDVDPAPTRELVPKQSVRWGAAASGETRVTISLASFDVGDADVAELLFSPGRQRVPAVGAACGPATPPCAASSARQRSGLLRLQVSQPGDGRSNASTNSPDDGGPSTDTSTCPSSSDTPTRPDRFVDRDHYRLPYFTGGAYYIARHVWHRHTPNAQGVQILTDSHLVQTSDLTRWHIQSLGNGRHLVQAPDLEPCTRRPSDPDVLTKPAKTSARPSSAPTTGPDPTSRPCPTLASDLPAHDPVRVVST